MPVRVETGTAWADDTISVRLTCKPFFYTLRERFQDREKVSRFWRRSVALQAFEDAWENVESLLSTLDSL